MQPPELPLKSAKLGRSDIDAAFEAMGQDEEYQAEAAQIMREFEQADWEALLLAEEHPW